MDPSKAPLARDRFMLAFATRAAAALALKALLYLAFASTTPCSHVAACSSGQDCQLSHGILRLAVRHFCMPTCENMMPLIGGAASDVASTSVYVLPSVQ